MPNNLLVINNEVVKKSLSMIESGDLLIPLNAGLIGKDNIKTEIGELISENNWYRSYNSEITLFESMDSVVQDLLCAIHIF